MSVFVTVLVRFRKWKCLDLILRSGCDVDLPTHENQTPLHLAVAMRDLGSVKILLRANANPNTIDRLGASPLDQAIFISRGLCNTFG